MPELTQEQYDEFLLQKDRIEELEVAENQLTRLVANTDIRKVLELQEKGVKGIQISATTPTPGVPTDTSPDINKMDNAALAKFLMETMGKTIKDTIIEEVDKIKEPVGYLLSKDKETREEAESRLFSEAESKYTDFKDYKKKIESIRTENPTLNPTEAYTLAKMRDGSPIKEITSNRTPTERPSSSIGRPETSKPRSEPLPTGRDGIRQVLSETLDKMDLSGIPSGE